MARTKVPITVFRDTGIFAANANVTVVNRATGQNATVYSTESGGTTMVQPLTCDTRGRCPGWVDRGVYSAICTGTGVTSYQEDFDSAPAADGAIDRAWLADLIINAAKMADQAITVAKLHPDNIPVGTVAMYWRPAASVPFPVNWQPLEGQTLVAGQHDFPVAGSVVLPDGRNVFALGADRGKAIGTAGIAESVGGAAPSVGNAPGIGGVQGYHARSLVHQHLMTAHYHGRGTLGASSSSSFSGSGSQDAHTHSFSQSNVGSDPAVWEHAATLDRVLGYLVTNSASNLGPLIGYVNTGGAMDTRQPNVYVSGSVSTSTSLSGTIGATGGVDGDSGNSQTSGTTANGVNLPSAQDLRPGSLGLVFIMKVKNS